MRSANRERKRTQPWYRQANQGSESGQAAGSRSALIVPQKPGNEIRPDPAEGSGAPGYEPVERKHARCIEIWIPCQRNVDGYGLTVHPDKTRLVRFSRPPQAGLRAERPETFDFLGFTHYWGKSHRGNWVLKRTTASSRLRRGLLAVRSWCRLNRHQQLGEQHVHLARQLRGHYAYYGITNNQRSLQAFREQVRGIWRTWLSRRNREESVPWEVFERIEQRFPLPPPRIVHSYITHAAKS